MTPPYGTDSAIALGLNMYLVAKIVVNRSEYEMERSGT